MAAVESVKESVVLWEEWQARWVLPGGELRDCFHGELVLVEKTQ